MRLFSPLALVFLITIPIVIMMYMLKQKSEERVISSIYLWEQALKDMEANTPWQKLKKNLLLFLQVLSLLLLVFALSNPFVFFKGSVNQNIILIIDNSGSMNALYENDITRIEAAKKYASELIKNSAPGTNFTIVSASKDTQIHGNTINDKAEAIRKVDGVRKSNSSGNMEDAISLVRALGKQYKSYKAIFFTDSNIDIKDINAEIYSLSSKIDNISLDYISHSADNGFLKVIVRVTNRSDVDISREISIFGEEKLILLQNIELKGKETKTVYFNDVPADFSYIYAEIREKDGLTEDNIIYDIVKTTSTKKVLLISKGNIFVEKALTLAENIELYKTEELDDMIKGYDLYIYDGIMPDKLNLDGSIMIINPTSGGGIFKMNGDVAGGRLQVMPHSTTKYMNNTYAAVSKLKDIEVPYWAETIMKSGENTAAFIGKYKSSNIAVLTFDLHNSDFVLTPEYPILVNNLMNHLMDAGSSIRTKYFCGESIEAEPSPDAKALYIRKPDGSTHNIDIKYPILPLSGLDETGVYSLVEILEKGEKGSLFAVNFPSEDESSVNTIVEEKSNTVDIKQELKSGQSLQNLIILLALLLLAIEWGVYAHGY